MQNAQLVILQTIESLIQDGEIDKALDVLLDLDTQADAGLRTDIIQQAGNYRQAKKMFTDDLIDSGEFRRASAKTRMALLELMKDIPKRVALNAKIKGLKTYQFDVPDDAHLEKIIGGTSSILRINWLEKALKASKAVCRVVCSDGSLGTGFLTKEGYVFTNNHVIGSAEAAGAASIEFNYEMDASGNTKNRIVYQLDAKDFTTSDKSQLDFARIKVIDRPDQPISQWGFVEFDPEAIPPVGDAVTIIQHPKGEDKQIALNANEVLGQFKQHLYYTTDTEPGSSGSPVFNKDWKVVAIHHAGKTMAEGGFQVNARGDVREANRGVLFREIFSFLNTGKTNASGGGTANTESFTGNTATQPLGTSTSTVSTPPVTNTVSPNTQPATPPVSTVPKFVVIYDLADAPQCQMLNKHLNVLKITKKIRVHNVNEVAAGLDPVVVAEQELQDADYIVALITVNLLNSSDWFNIVYSSLESGRRIIPIKIGDADIEGTGLDKLRSLPTMNRAVVDFPNQDAAYTNIVGELKKLLPAR